VATECKKHKHGPLGCKVDDLNPANAEHYCASCGAEGTYAELAKIPCKRIRHKVKQICEKADRKISDKINSGFELAGGFFIILHILRVLHDKSVAGVSVMTVLFFTIWGYWNLYYYKSIRQKWSLRATYFITAMNSVWLVLLIYYKLKGG
jgi:hypothetical protein